jgi:hypothetical protein
MPSRIAALRGLLRELRAPGDVHWTTPHAIHASITGDPPDETP